MNSRNIQSKFRKFYTYFLELETDIPKSLVDKTHFYWMSAYQFDLVTQKYPEILDRHHFCGFGITYEHILKKLENKNKISACLSYQQWQQFIRSQVEKTT